MNQYRILEHKGEGTFSYVVKAQHITTQQYVAIKILKSHYTQQQTKSLYEILCLTSCKSNNSINIIELLDIIYNKKTQQLALIFPLMDVNLYEYYTKINQHISLIQVKFIMYDLLNGIYELHSKKYFHRDIKPENILLTFIKDKQTNNNNNNNNSNVTLSHPCHNFILKISDFGSAKPISSYSIDSVLDITHPHTEYISTRWYRAPECILTNGYYTYYMDIWSIGCVFYELLTNNPLFPGNNELDQIHKICNILGDIPYDIYNQYNNIDNICKNLTLHNNTHYGNGIGLYTHCSNMDQNAVNLLDKMLRYDMKQRISIKNALKHNFFDEIRDYYKNNNYNKQTIDFSSLHNNNNNNKQHSNNQDQSTAHNNNTDRTIHNDNSNKLPNLQCTNNKRINILKDKTNTLIHNKSHKALGKTIHITQQQHSNNTHTHTQQQFKQTINKKSTNLPKI